MIRTLPHDTGLPFYNTVETKGQISSMVQNGPLTKAALRVSPSGPKNGAGTKAHI